jgi:mannose-6-phosphate isomerase-like protein (cupin superfamily)
MHVIKRDELPQQTMSRELVGDEHALAVSFIFIDAPPGQSVSLHRHAYDEIFVVQEGEATVLTGSEERLVRAGDIVAIPAGEPHGFVNSGNVRLRQINIHVSPRFVTEWLEPESSTGSTSA